MALQCFCYRAVCKQSQMAHCRSINSEDVSAAVEKLCSRLSAVCRLHTEPCMCFHSRKGRGCDTKQLKTGFMQKYYRVSHSLPGMFLLDRQKSRHVTVDEFDSFPN